MSKFKVLRGCVQYGRASLISLKNLKFLLYSLPDLIKILYMHTVLKRLYGQGLTEYAGRFLPA
jgi:hypothetical protein